MAYSQSNGQVEVINRNLVRGLKVKLEHRVLWSYRTTPQVGTSMTPFHLVYGEEVVVPVEIEVTSARVSAYGEDNGEKRAMELV